MPGSSEQIVFNPIFFQGAFIVDSTVPANNVPTSCTTNQDTGFTYVLSVAADWRHVCTLAFPHRILDAQVDTAAIQTDATGTPYIVSTVEAVPET